MILILLFAAPASATSAYTSKFYWQHEDGRVIKNYMDGRRLVGSEDLNPSRLAAEWKIKAAADMNDNGHPDLILMHDDGGLAVGYMNGPNIERTAWVTNPRGGNKISPGWDLKAVYDLNNTREALR